MKRATLSVLVIAAILVLLGTIVEASRLTNLRSRNRNEDNSINPERKLAYRKRDWPKISQSPPQVVNSGLGDRLELECEVVGSPPPIIHWIRGDNVQQKAENYESNEIPNQLDLGSGLYKTKSRLIVDCVMPQHEGLYTCVAVAGGKITLAQTSRVLLEGNHVNNLTAMLTACRADTLHGAQRVARVTQWSPVTLQEQGRDVTLPCRVTGRPAPVTYWLDGDNQLVGENDPRFKILPNGDLLIMKLQWSDMGSYRCVASNLVGSDNVESFVYPLLSESS